MNWLRKKIVNWLFGVDYVKYVDALKNYAKAVNDNFNLRNEIIKIINKPIISCFFTIPPQKKTVKTALFINIYI